MPHFLYKLFKFILFVFNIDKLKNNFNALNNFIFIPAYPNLEVFSVG